MATRIFIDHALPEQPQAFSLNLPDDAARHVGQVLRMRVGEALVLFNGRGGEWPAQIEAVEKRAVRVCLLERTADDVARGSESPLHITLLQCVSKGERMDYTLQKAVELGATRLVPLLSSRSVVKLDDERWEKKREHWRGILISACEQCGRTRVPELGDLEKLERWLSQAPPVTQGHLRLVLAPGGQRRLRELPLTQQVELLVGPEGGLSEAEIALAVRAGFEPIGLGPRILRTETAGVAALAALQTLWGDVG